MERRLAAILLTDMVGYSRLMGLDEAGTIARQKADRKNVIDPKISAHGGRVVKSMGAGVLAEFPSVVDAVQCAIEVQEAIAKRDTDVPEHRRLKYRIGINLGDIVIDGDDILGDGVNVAARLEGLADPGGICISSTVHDHLAGKLDIAFEDAGEESLKNVARPVRVWHWRADLSARDASETGEPPPPPDKPSIAVLPFDNMSGDREQEFFADGMTEDIITALSRYRWLTTIARNSSFAFRSENATISEIARRLGVRYVLGGSVRTAGRRVRVSAQLVDATSNKQLWAERYDGELEDIFALQDDITRRVSASLAPELEKAEWLRLQSTRAPNLNAWQAYLKGIWHFYKHTEGDLNEATKWLQQAVETDQDFGQALAGLAYAKFYLVTDGYTDTPEATLREAIELAQRAVAIDDQDAFAHFVLGRIYSIRFDYDQAVSELEFAIRLNPSLADAYHGLAFALTYSGRPKEALPHFEAAHALSPHDANVWAFFGVRAVAYIQLEQYDEAIRNAREAVQKRFAKYWAFSHLASALGHGGKPEEAKRAAADLLSRKPEFTVSFAREHLYYYSDKKTLEHYLNGLRKAGVRE